MGSLESAHVPIVVNALHITRGLSLVHFLRHNGSLRLQLTHLLGSCIVRGNYLLLAVEEFALEVHRGLLLLVVAVHCGHGVWVLVDCGVVVVVQEFGCRR